MSARTRTLIVSLAWSLSLVLAFASGLLFAYATATGR